MIQAWPAALGPLLDVRIKQGALILPPRSLS